MQLHRTELIPRSTTPARRLRLGHFLQSHNDAVEVFRGRFERPRHSNVNVMKRSVHFFSELCEKPAAASNCFSRSASPGCALRYALNSDERFRGMLSDVHSAERKCLARNTIWPM